MARCSTRPIARRCSGAKSPRPRRGFEGYERRRGRYFYIVERAGVETPGLVLSGLGERDFAVLDRYEEVPRLYTRVKIEVASGWRRGASMLGLPAHAGRCLRPSA